MKSKTKKYIARTGRILWMVLGLILIFFTLYWYIFIIKIGDLGGVMAGTILFSYFLTALIIFATLTFIYYIIKIIIKLIKKKK